MQTLTIIQPDDMHLHLRDGEALKAVLPFTARQMGRAVIMPNLKPPVASVADALAYRARIEAALPEGSTFETLMTLYLTDNTTRGLVHVPRFHEDFVAVTEEGARWLVERGVRFVQLYSGGNENQRSWDGHADILGNHTQFAGETDRPVAGLLEDLAQRGLLEETLVVVQVNTASFLLLVWRHWPKTASILPHNIVRRPG